MKEKYIDVVLHPTGNGDGSAFRAARDATIHMMRTLPTGHYPTTSDVLISEWRHELAGVWEHKYLALEIREDIRSPNSTYYIPWIVQDHTRQNPTEDMPYLVLGTAPVGDIVFQSLIDAISFTLKKFTNSRVRTRT